MIKANIFLVLLSTLGLLTSTPSYSDQNISAQEQTPSIRISEGSSLKLKPQHCPSHVFGFSGHVELDGRLDVYWYEHVIDAESPTDLLTETRFGLDFYPTPESQSKLPVVLFADEQQKSNMKIRLGGLGHRQAESLLLMFGFQQAKIMIKQKKNQSFDGRITLSVFSTFMECDARQYHGEAVQFRSKSGPVEMTTTTLAHGCGG